MLLSFLYSLCSFVQSFSDIVFVIIALLEVNGPLLEPNGRLRKAKYPTGIQAVNVSLNPRSKILQEHVNITTSTDLHRPTASRV